MQYQEIHFERRGSGAWITLYRPKDMNALSLQMLDELEFALSECQKDNSIGVVVFTGTGTAFSAGADLKDIMSSLKDPTLGKKDLLDRCDDFFGLLRRFPKPVIAAINGLTMGGGLELVMCCDLVFAAESAKIGDGHSKFGFVPGAGGAAILPKKVGLHRAKYLLFTGDLLPAAVMESYGLVNKVVPDAQLVDEVERFVEKLAAKSPLGLRRMKEVANASLDHSEEDALRHEMNNLRQHIRSYDQEEGLKAFLEKRKPEFRGY